MKGLIESVVVAAIIIGSTAAVVTLVGPFLTEGREAQSFTVAKDTLRSVDDAVQQLLVEAPGSRRSIQVDAGTGRFIVSGTEERIKLRLEGFAIVTPGAIIQEGNVQIRGGSIAEAREDDVDGDGFPDLVLQNGMVSFAVRKIGSETAWAGLNTTTLITRITNLRTGTSVVPRSGMYVNDLPGTGEGTGYTALTREGQSTESASILVFVNSTVGVTYEALFTLGSATDFVDVQFKNIHGV